MKIKVLQDKKKTIKIKVNIIKPEYARYLEQ